MLFISCSSRITAAASRSVFARSPARAFSSSHKPFNHKLKFEDSDQNPDSKKNASGNSNNTNNTTTPTSANIKPAKRGKLDLSSEKKFSNFIKEFNRTVDVKRTTLKSANLHSLPRVASTSHLDLRRFRQDILYSGYRPLLLPIKNDCKPLRFDKTGGLAQAGTSGGSKATYVVPNMWNNSALGTEHFKEMDNIPYRVLMRLKPFQKPPAPAKAKTPRSINSTSEYLTKSSSSTASSSSSSSLFASPQQNQVNYSFEESENENDQQINWKEYFSKRGFKD